MCIKCHNKAYNATDTDTAKHIDGKLRYPCLNPNASFCNLYRLLSQYIGSRINNMAHRYLNTLDAATLFPKIDTDTTPIIEVPNIKTSRIPVTSMIVH